jgi:hypothetical protein
LRALGAGLTPPLLIALAGLLFFAELVLHPTATLYSDYSDLLPFHLPDKRFLVRSWQQTGEVPLWTPHNLGGMPFVHDTQVAAFYPLHLPLYLLPEEAVGAAMSWLVVLHVLIAGWCAYAYARRQGLDRGPALVAALGTMFAGKWMLHLLGGGHYNMVPLAWLPLLLLLLEEAIRRGSLFRATWAGAVFSLFLLAAYPYITFYTGLFTALWTLGAALDRAGWFDEAGVRSRRRTAVALAWWAAAGAWCVLVAVLLGAVQLFPALEAARHASRGSGIAPSAEMLAGTLRCLTGVVGPALSRDANWLWEDRAGLGLLWLVAAGLAPVVCRSRRVRFQAAACLGWVVFAAGGAVLVQKLPGFRLFQLPSRMLLLAALPVALLAGFTTQALFAAPAEAVLRRRSGRIAVKLAAAILLLTGLHTALLAVRGEPLRLPVYWLTLSATLPAAWWLLTRFPAASTRRLAVWAVLLLIDLWALAWPLVEVRPDADVYAETACTRYLSEHRGERGRVLDVNPSDRSANATPLWPGMAAVHGIEPVRGFNPIDVARYKEFLQFVAGREEPLRPLDRMYTSALLGTFPVEEAALADLLGIRYLLLPDSVPLDAVVRDPSARRAWVKVAGDPAPRTFAFIPARRSAEDVGVQPLPPHAVYENRRALPRAFVVSRAAGLPADRSDAFAALRTTDLRRCVLLEGDCPDTVRQAADVPQPSVTVRAWEPNRIVLEVEPSAPGYLVLTDLWYPGWTCTVDGRPEPVERADFLFRAVRVGGDDRQEVIFRFDPASYRWGRRVSATALAALLGLALSSLLARSTGRWFATLRRSVEASNASAKRC